MEKVDSVRKEFSWQEVLACRNELFGISILWIISFHIYRNVGITGLGWKWIEMVLSRGNMGVDIFLFLSAIGLSKSIQSNDTITFYKHRFQRVVFPYLIVAFPFFIWFDFIHYNDGLWQYILNVTTINFWLTGRHPVWYVAFIIVLYLFFPMLYKWDKKTGHISTICILILCVVLEYVMYKNGFWLFRTSEKALSRIPVFMVGFLAAPMALSNRHISLWQVLMLLVLGLALFYFITIHPPHLVLMRYCYCPISIAIIVCYAYLHQIVNVKWIWHGLAWVGSISLELYMIHILIRRVITVTNSWELISPILWWITIPIVSFPLAFILQKLTMRINQKWQD